MLYGPTSFTNVKLNTEVKKKKNLVIGVLFFWKFFFYGFVLIFIQTEFLICFGCV